MRKVPIETLGMNRLVGTGAVGLVITGPISFATNMCLYCGGHIYPTFLYPKYERPRYYLTTASGGLDEGDVPNISQI